MAYNGSAYGYNGPQQPPSLPGYQPLWYLFENGRAYNVDRKCMQPCDEEECDRLDILHKFCSITRQYDSYGGLHQRPLPSRPRILDLGCGTGIWAIDMAYRYNEQADIIGWDISPIQPATHLKPGTGLLEHVEIDFRPQCDGMELPIDSRLQTWSRELTEAMNRNGTPMEPPEDIGGMLHSIGYVDIEPIQKRVPYNPWPDSEHEKEMARWFNLAVMQGLGAMTMAPLTRMNNYTKEKVEDLIEGVKHEICARSMRSFCTM